jgi:hypothetical protein
MVALTGFGDTFKNDLLKLIFNATTITGIAQDDAAPIGNLYVALHTADPTEAGDQTSNEVVPGSDYTGYARVAVVRTAGGWTVTANAVENTAVVTFPECTGNSCTVTHFSIGTLTSGAGKILAGGVLAAPLAVSNGIVPEFDAGELTCTVTP